MHFPVLVLCAIDRLQAGVNPSPCRHMRCTGVADRTLQEPTLPSLLLQAYSLYRTGKLEEALTALEQVSQSQQAVPRLQLQAQLLYRLGRYREAADALSRLQKQNQVGRGTCEGGVQPWKA